MKLKGLICIALMLLSVSMLSGSSNVSIVKATPSGSSEPPATEWNKTYGGASWDCANSVVQTSDGGYAIAGYTRSFGAGKADFWLVKTDAAGNTQWNKTYGGASWDGAYSVVQTSDGGYIIAGETESFGAGYEDFWLVKTDGSGNMQWNKTYGGADIDWAWSVVQTSDGGYAVAGSSYSFGAGDGDFWLVKTDGSGNMQWSKTYGGTRWDCAYSVVQTSDGGYIIAGETESFGAGASDFWLVKTDTAGNAEWNKTYGGARSDYAESVVQTSDGGYIIAGATFSFGAGSLDFWLVKTDSAGNMQWNITYGGTYEDLARSVVQTSDGGYIIAGHTWSFGAGSWDFWLVKTDGSGNMQWSKTYGGAGSDCAYSVVQTSDGGYAVAGSSYSFGAGEADFWLVKVASEVRSYEIVAVPGSTPNIDGQIYDPLEWSDASTTSFNGTTVYVKQNGENLYIAFIIPDDTIQYYQDRCTIYLDVNNDKGEALQSDDIGLSIGRDGTLIELNVTDGIFTPTDVSGWTAKAYSGKDEFHAEFNIAYAKIEVTAGVAKTIGVAFVVLDYYTPELSVPFFWPPAASESPSTWGSITSNEYNWVPEFPSAIILPLFMALTIIAVIFIKRGLPRKPKKNAKPPFFCYILIAISPFDDSALESVKEPQT